MALAVRARWSAYEMLVHAAVEADTTVREAALAIIVREVAAKAMLAGPLESG